MGMNNQSENNYINMVKENYELLIQLGINKEELDEIVSGDKRNYPNMDNKIVEMVFFIETLKTFGLFSGEKRLQRDTRLGGGFYTDGYIYGYDLTYADDKYRIVLDDKYITDERKCLEFGKTDDIEMLKQQKEMLEKFKGFSNSQTISRKLNFVEQNIKLLQARETISQNGEEIDSKKEKIELLELLYEKDEKQRYDIVKNLESDDKKIELMELLYEGDEQKRVQIIISLESDDKKIELLDSIKDDWYRTLIIASLKSLEKSIELLDRIENEANRTYIIVRLENPDNKIELLDTIDDDRYKAEIISSLKDDNKKIELLDTIDENYHRVIIESLSKERLEAEFTYVLGKGWQRQEKKPEVKEATVEVDEQEITGAVEPQIRSGDIASLDVESEITKTELEPIQEKGIKAFIRKIINKIKGIGK